LAKQSTAATDQSSEFLNFALLGNTVFVERLDWFTMSDKHVSIHVVGVFEFDASGKITSWRDYWDSAEIRAKVGRFTPTTTVGRQE
jgi:limonene-1,2-epoxide hydrolase